MEQVNDRKEIAKKRVRGLLIFLIIVLSMILLRDVYLFFKGWF